MKKILKAFKFSSVLMLLAFISCDKDFTAIESDIRGEQNFSTQSEKFPVTAYTKKLNPVQTNDLPSNLLGVFNDLTLDGITTANVVTQVIPTTFNPDFGGGTQIESVILTIPYFSNSELNDLGDTEYKLDSVFGNTPIKLSIYHNNYFLRDIDPQNVEAPQNYYSNANQTINFDNYVGELLYENEGFTPSAEEIILEELNDDGELEEVGRIAPALRVSLMQPLSLFWRTNIIDNQDMPVLSNQNNFVNFFRGLYFKTEAINNDGNMLMLDFLNSSANIVITYTFTNPTNAEERSEGTFIMNFNGNRVNTLSNNFNMPIVSGDPVNGDENLSLKGGEGAMAVINLFDGENTDANNNTDNTFETFKKQFVEVDESSGKFIKSKRLINEANLIFYVNQNRIQTGGVPANEPDRVVLYDLKNNFPIIDFFTDPTASTTDPLNSRVIYSPVLERDDVTKEGIRYKIRLTEHIKNIILNDSTNVQLGLIVSTNVNEVQRSEVFGNEDEVGVGAVLSPRGTVLYGSKPNVPETERVQLEIFYTEPDN